MRPFPHIASERLILRGFKPEDAPALERLVGLWEVVNTTLTIPHPYPAGGGATWIATQPGAWNEQTHLTLAVTEKENPEEILGAIGLALVMPHLRAELGYWIAPRVWGRGYATEAAQAIIAYGFSTLGLNRIEGQIFTRNPASGRVLEKAGMRFEGVHRAAFRRWEKFEDSAMYAILAEDWKSATSSRDARPD